MKIIIKLILVGILVASCGGGGGDDNPPVNPPPDNVEVTLGNFNLTFPENNLICTEGIDNGAGQIDINFQWSTATNATSYELEVTNQETNTKETFSSTSPSKVVTLDKATQFSWRVTAKVDAKTSESATWNFYSVGTSTENFAPFPAEITVVDNTDSTVTVSWLAEDIDNDIATYTVRIGVKGDLNIILENSAELNTTYNFTAGLEYEVHVITIDERGNSSTSKTGFRF